MLTKTKNRLRDRFERLVDACYWRLGRVRYSMRVTVPVVELVVDGHRGRSSRVQLRADITAWCRVALADQVRLDVNKLVFKHKSSMVTFRLSWAKDVADSERTFQLSERVAFSVLRATRNAIGIAE